MEFPFDINKVLPLDITLIRNKDIILDANKGNIHKTQEMQIKLHLAKVIDAMGNASGTAQNLLRGAITSVLRMKSSDHHLYILKDQNGNKGLGSVIGMIRVGFKHLFLVDTYGQQHECQPLCVLDFYVHESKQRHGYGKILFNHMLHSEQIHPHELAIDRPSGKFVNFLAKHYSLDKPIHQLNKFIVFDSFFKDMSAVGGIDEKRSRRSAPVNRKMFSRTPLYQDTRYCTSASVHKGLRTIHPHPDNLLSRQLCVLPPIHTAGDGTQNNSGLSGDELNPVPISRQSKSSLRPLFSKNSNSETQVRNFSRHGVKQSSKSYPDLPSTIVKDDEVHNKAADCNSNMETHTLRSCTKQSEEQFTSQHNPLAKPIPKVASSSSKDDDSYTVDKVLRKLKNNKEKLGTGWNVFGVPNSSSFTANPYSSIKRSSFYR